MNRLYIHTGLFTKQEFDGNIFPKSERNHIAKTKRLTDLICAVEKVSIENSLLGNDELKAKINFEVFGKANTRNTLKWYVDKYLENVDAERTRGSYVAAMNWAEEYRGGTLIGDIDYAWVEGYKKFLEDNGLAGNTVNLYMSKIHSVVNECIRQNVLSYDPFSNVKFPHVVTQKRNLSVEELRFMRDSVLKPKYEVSRDMFMLSFYLVGINPKDLLTCRKEQMHDGRINYNRSKTKKLYSIKVEPEALKIIDKYPGTDNLLSICENGKLGVVNERINRHLGKIIDGITMYYARHTWATIAYELDIPMQTIHSALGHSNGSGVTNVYVNFNQKKIDEANRMVIDFVNGEK